MTLKQFLKWSFTDKSILFLFDHFLSKNRFFFKDKIEVDIRHYITNDFRVIYNNIAMVEEKYNFYLERIDQDKMKVIHELENCSESRICNILVKNFGNFVSSQYIFLY